MPRPVQAQGRPGTQITPAPDLLATPLVGTRTATVDLRKPGSTTVWDDALEQTVATPVAPYASREPARIQAITAGERTVEVASDTVHVRGYLVTLDQALTPQVGDLIDIADCADLDLTGRILRITDVIRGSFTVERQVFATLND